MNIRIIGRAVSEPYNVRTTALCPRPFFNNSCPGSIERKLSSSGAPRNIDGMKSINVWVIDIAVIKITKAIIGIDEKEVIEASKRAAIKLICIPGKRPVAVPNAIPISNAKIISISIIIYNLEVYIFCNSFMIILSILLPRAYAIR